MTYQVLEGLAYVVSFVFTLVYV